MATPAYIKIQESILKRIEAGTLKPLDPIDSERALAAAHSVSLMTARHALADLERRGIIGRRPRSGSFVAPPRIEFNKLLSFTEEMAAKSIQSASSVLSLKTIRRDPQIAALLLLPEESHLLRIERLRLGGGQPFAIEICYLSAERYGKLSRAALDKSSLYSVLWSRFGIQLAYADEEVDAIMPTAEVARTLTIKTSDPLLRIRQVVFSTAGERVLYGICLNRADRHTLRIRRAR